LVSCGRVYFVYGVLCPQHPHDAPGKYYQVEALHPASHKRKGTFARPHFGHQSSRTHHSRPAFLFRRSAHSAHRSRQQRPPILRDLPLEANAVSPDDICNQCVIDPEELLVNLTCPAEAGRLCRCFSDCCAARTAASQQESNIEPSDLRKARNWRPAPQLLPVHASGTWRV